MNFLIVDDIEAKAALVRIILWEYFGNKIQVSIATKFNTARTYIQNGDSYSIIFLDGDLKDEKNGIDLIPIIKSQRHLATAEIVMISDNESLVDAAVEKGVSKSISPDSLSKSAHTGNAPEEIFEILQKIKKAHYISSH